MESQDGGVKPKKGDSPKSQRTKQAIAKAALKIFSKQGFEKATMRQIAKEAGLGLGTTYYHFKSKEDLLLFFYRLADRKSREILRKELAGKNELSEVLETLLRAKLQAFTPYREILSELRYCRHEENPLGPPPLAGEIVARETKIIQLALDQVGFEPPKRLAPVLPKVIFLYFQLVVLNWLGDNSDSQVKSRRIISVTLPVLSYSLSNAKSRFFRPILELLEGLYVTE